MPERMRGFVLDPSVGSFDAAVRVLIFYSFTRLPAARIVGNKKTSILEGRRRSKATPAVPPSLTVANDSPLGASHDLTSAPDNGGESDAAYFAGTRFGAWLTDPFVSAPASGSHQPPVLCNGEQELLVPIIAVPYVRMIRRPAAAVNLSGTNRAISVYDARSI